MATFAFTNWAIAYFISGAFMVGLSLLLIQKKRSDPIVILFAIGSILGGLTAFSAALMVCITDAHLWLKFAYFYYIADIIALTFLYHFSHMYRVKGSIWKHWKVMVVYLLPLLVSLLIIINPALMDADFENKESHPTGHILPARADTWVGDFFQGWVVLIGIATFVNCIWIFRQKEDLELRRQGAYFMMAYFFPLIGGIMTNFFKGVLGVHLMLNTAILMMPISMSILAYGILKERLFDIDIIVKRSIQYSLVTFALTGVFFLVEKMMENLVKIEVVGQTKLSGFISAGVVILSSMPVKAIGKKLVEKWFPDVKALDPLEAQKMRDLEIYKEQLRVALAGGSVEWNERRLLGQLRKSYEIKLCICLAPTGNTSEKSRALTPGRDFL
ncbi:MAG: histidine kinase N-terminal 7TM domain-containing protein [Candidatus Thermoplasmatota archaeon]|jgi:hypothetical protein|nr:histidine kinase N-terminal 7TM domain-containing protein [Candidatus Thermoplasmatota archaeon]